MIVNMKDDELDNATLGENEVWANEDNEKTARGQLNAYATVTGEKDVEQFVIPEDGDDGLFSANMSKIYRYGVCGDATYSDCAKKFDTVAGHVALEAVARNVPEPATKEDEDRLQSLPPGNIAETACADKSVADCAVDTQAQAKVQEQTLPDAQFTQAANVTKKQPEQDNNTTGADKAAQDTAAAEPAEKCSTIVHIGDSLSDPIRDDLYKAYTDAGASKVVINANGGRAFAWEGGGKSDSGNGMQAIEAVKQEARR